MTPFADRARYRPMGSAVWGRFVPLVLQSWASAAALAVLLHVAYKEGWYFVAVIPFFLALPLVGLVLLAVAQGHCRRRSLGAFVGLIAGLIFYLGSYHAGLVDAIGLENAQRLDLLPRYIARRKATEKIGRWFSSAKQQEERPMLPGPIDVVFNWAFFTLELGGVLALTSVIGAARAARSYCERCRDWKRQLIVAFPPGSGPLILGSLETGTLASLARLRQVSFIPNQPCTVVAIEACATEACPVFGSIKDVRTPGYGSLNRFDAAPGRKVLPRTTLTPEEADALLQRKHERSPLGLDASSDRSTVATLNVETFPPSHAGPLLDPARAVFGNLLCFLPVLAMIGGLALASGAAFIAASLEERGALSAISSVGCIALVVLGVALSIGSAWIGLRYPTAVANIYFLRKARRVIGRRAGRCVDPEDPEAMFVEIVPRVHWGAIMLDTATEVGFLRVDPTRRELRFEGNGERWTIPTEAILSCEVDGIEVAVQGVRHAYYFAVVVAQQQGEPVDFPMAPRGRWQGRFISKKERRRVADELRARIQILLQPLDPGRNP